MYTFRVRSGNHPLKSRKHLQRQREQMEAVFTTTPNKMVDTQEAMLERWVRALEERDLETKGHTYRVVGMAVRLASALGLSGEALLNVRRGAFLHDIGKLNIPDTVLHKEGQLSKGDLTVLRTHPKIACDMLKYLGFPEPAIEIPYCHHEKWDGTGYPRGLKGEQIPFSARLFAVVDVYDALTTNRSYRAAMPREDVLLYLKYQKGKHFEPKIVDVFLSLVEAD